MVEFEVKEVALQLGSTTQNIYKKIDKLVKQGLAYRDEKGHPYIYDTGLQFLQQEKIKRKTVANNKYSNKTEVVENKENETKSKLQNEMETVAKMYKKLYEEQKEESLFWRTKFEEKDRAYNEITSQLLLTGSVETKRKGLFSRIFNK